jgi:hypothetical protein
MPRARNARATGLKKEAVRQAREKARLTAEAQMYSFFLCASAVKFYEWNDHDCQIG